MISGEEHENVVDEIVCSNIAGPTPEDGSLSVGNCPGDIANGSRRFCPSLLVALL